MLWEGPMIHALASRLTDFCVTHELINPKLYPFLLYKLELFLSTAFFSCVLILIAILSHTYIEILSFAATVFLFRRRMGGWHAPAPWLCQILSILLIIVFVLALGPLIDHLHPVIILISSLVLDVFSYFLKPSYPPQLYYTDNEIQANTKQVHRLLLLLVTVQLLSFFWLDTHIVTYTFLGLAVTVLTVLLEKIKHLQKGLGTS